VLKEKKKREAPLRLIRSGRLKLIVVIKESGPSLASLCLCTVVDETSVNQVKGEEAKAEDRPPRVPRLRFSNRFQVTTGQVLFHYFKLTFARRVCNQETDDGRG